MNQDAESFKSSSFNTYDSLLLQLCAAIIRFLRIRMSRIRILEKALQTWGTKKWGNNTWITEIKVTYNITFVWFSIKFPTFWRSHDILLKSWPLIHNGGKLTKFQNGAVNFLKTLHHSLFESKVKISLQQLSYGSAPSS